MVPFDLSSLTSMSIMGLDILAFDNRNKESSQEEYALHSYLHLLKLLSPFHIESDLWNSYTIVLLLIQFVSLKIGFMRWLRLLLAGSHPVWTRLIIAETKRPYLYTISDHLSFG